jgi:uncharacterized protein with HEPN domain
MLEEIRQINAAMDDVGPERFASDWLLNNAVTRGLEIISEASRHLSAELKASEPEMPWPKIAAIGNILRHAYEKVESNTLYRIVIEDLRDLEPALIRMQKRLRA